MKFLNQLGLAGVTFALCLSAHAATSGTLTLQGTIAQSLSISVVPTDSSPNDGTYSGLDLTTNTDIEVANVREISNAANGYKVLVSHQGKLKHSSDANSIFNYRLVYENSEVNAGNNIEVANVGGGIYDVNKKIRVRYTGVPASSLKAGTYAETVTFTIQAK